MKTIIKYVNAFNLNTDKNEKKIELNNLVDIIFKTKGLTDKGINERIKDEEDIIYLYFDIDYEIEDDTTLKQNKLNKLLIFIKDNFNIFRNIRGYYLKGYDNIFNDCEDIKIYFNEYEPEEKTNKTKIFSSHIIFNYSDYYKNIVNIINDFCDAFNCKSKKDIDFIDVKAYNKTVSTRLLRNIYSPKCLTVNNVIKTGIKFNEEIDTKEFIKKSFIQTNEINKDIEINYYIDKIFSICINEEQEEQQEQKQTIIITESDCEPSIFEGVKTFNVDLNSFETIQLFYDIKDNVLPIETIKKELYLFLSYYKIFDEYTLNGLNDEWIEKVINMFKYKQDKTNIKTLYYLMSKQTERKKELKEIKDYDNLKRCKISINKIDNFINKYLQTWFINIKHFDINENIEIDKTEKILMNVFKDINDCYYLINKDNVIKSFTNKTQLKNYFHCSGSYINKVVDKMVCFENAQDYNLLKLDFIYSELTKEEHEEINNNINDLLNLLKTTFISSNDFDIYLSWWHEKLKHPNKQLKKNIINCPDSLSGKDSLKTYFKDLFTPFLEESKPTYKEMIKTLSGSYFDCQLITIEEINTFNIKEKSELIEKIKMTTETTKLNIERKNQNPILKDVRFNYYINTNHDISSLFINKSDCEPLIKRFKIFKRKGIDNINDYNDLLNYFNKDDTNNVHKYCLMKYIINEINDYDFYNCELNDYENKLINDSLIDDDNEKINIDKSIEELKTDIINKYIDSRKKFKIKKFYNDYFKNYKLNFKSFIYTLSHNNIVKKMTSTNHCELIKIDKLINDFFECNDVGEGVELD